MQVTDQITEVYNKFRQFLKRCSQKELEKRSYYSNVLVMWLMIYQRLHGAISLSNLLESTNNISLKGLKGRRKISKQKSKSTSGLSMARSRLSLEVVIKLIDELCEWMLDKISPEERLYVVDGSTFELMKSEELSEKYPPAECGYYPMMRALICTEINSGITVRPEIGALTGSKQASEIQLFKKQITRLPEGSTLMGDRNFGIYVVAKLSQERGLDVILRLTDSRAQKINGKKLPKQCDKEVVWRPSKDELRSHPELKEEEYVKGRLVCIEIKEDDGKKVKLNIFTTTNLSKLKLKKIYQKRWRIEVDIRDIKKSMNMDFIRVKSEDMALKELYLGLCAYNLTRKIICIATEKLGIDPRDVGFLRAQTAIKVQSERLLYNHTKKKQLKIVYEIYMAMKRCLLTKRKNCERHEPRAVVRHKHSNYPTLKGNRHDF